MTGAFNRCNAVGVVAGCLAICFAGHAKAELCPDGRQMTITGVIEKVDDTEHDRKIHGKVFLQVASSMPCEVHHIDVAASKFPASCVRGAGFTAKGKTEDFMEIFLHATTISCR